MSGNATLAPDLATTSTRLSEIEAREPSRRSSKLEWIALHSLGIAMGLLFLLPFVFIFLTSVMSDEQTLTRDLWPQTWEWHNFQQTWETPGFATCPDTAMNLSPAIRHIHSRMMAACRRARTAPSASTGKIRTDCQR